MNAGTRDKAMRLAKARRDCLQYGAASWLVDRLVAAGDVYELEDLASRSLRRLMTDRPRISADLAQRRAARGGNSQRGQW
ncbi:MAG: hypothetical protein M3O70_08815 [Actinomycetota bacterium]|nr:hypothetical protein [Actinomycetota bacterium]